MTLEKFLEEVEACCNNPRGFVSAFHGPANSKNAIRKLVAVVRRQQDALHKVDVWSRSRGTTIEGCGAEARAAHTDVRGILNEV